MGGAFSKDITFLSKVLQDDNSFKDENVTKTAIFKELNQSDKASISCTL